MALDFSNSHHRYYRNANSILYLQSLLSNTAHDAPGNTVFNVSLSLLRLCKSVWSLGILGILGIGGAE